MKKILLVSVLAALSLTTAFAQDTDLTIPGERWLGKFTAYVCADGNTNAASVPSELAAYNVVFGRLTTDITLDNYLIKATFTEDGVQCNYSSILLADNAAWTIKLIDSKAFSANNESSCIEGKKIIDAALADNTYKYLHGRAAIFAPVVGAEASCGTGSTTVGLHFQVVGKI